MKHQLAVSLAVTAPQHHKNLNVLLTTSLTIVTNADVYNSTYCYQQLCGALSCTAVDYVAADMSWYMSIAVHCESSSGKVHSVTHRCVSRSNAITTLCLQSAQNLRIHSSERAVQQQRSSSGAAPSATCKH
eukprot:15230-Heterococcus_DN1.PRE.1